MSPARIIRSLLRRMRIRSQRRERQVTPVPVANYWHGRQHLGYYRQALAYARTVHPTSLLDVGGGVSRGCRYLLEIDCPIKVSVELDMGIETLEGVVTIKQDFSAWRPDRVYDVALCLQVLEHLPDPKRFTEKLFAVGKAVVISVPYQWEFDRTPGHIHDPVDEEKLHAWTNRDPSESIVMDKRLICLYAGASMRA